MKSRSPFNHWIILFVICGIIINYLLSQLVILFDLPVYFDTIGTIFVGATCGYLPGVFVGFLSNMLNAFLPGLIGTVFPATGKAIEPMTLYYSVLSVVIAFLSSYFSKIGMFKKWWKIGIVIITFSFIGGVLGSFLTWALYGLNFGDEMSAPFVKLIYESLHVPGLLAQVLADTLIDILDKTIVVTIIALAFRFMPNKWLKVFPNGYYHFKDENKKYISSNVSYGLIDHHKSLRRSVTLLIVFTSLILGVIGITTSTVLYNQKMTNHYKDVTTSSSNLCIDAINGDHIKEYLQVNSEGKYVETLQYYEDETKLINIRNAFEGEVEYIYIYQIKEDGCIVVFDLDTPGVLGENLGTSLPLEYPFNTYQNDFLNGKQIEPLTSNGAYGWIFSKYTPIYATDGTCVAYLGVDIAMKDVITDRYMFAIQIFSILFGSSIVIVAFALWLTQIKVVEPIKALTKATSNYVFGRNKETKVSFNALRSLDIKTGNEIESLYDAISKETSDMENYIQEISDKNNYITTLQDNIIMSFAEMVESRDSNTGNHVKRTSKYVNILCDELLEMKAFPVLLTKEFSEQIIKSAPLHDVGKIKIPDAILNKPGKLTDEEFSIIKTHTIEGKIILEKAIGGIEGDNYLKVACNMALYHHERYDGKGYPNHIAGNDIPICAKIMAVADVFDALTSKRSYKEPFPIEKSINIILEESGHQFDPIVCEAFKNALNKIINALEEFNQSNID